MSKQLRLVLLNDNQGKPGFVTEHGFALWIEMDHQRILFDSGNDGSVLVANAAAAGVDLSSVDSLVLSHGHYDHTGGIPQVLDFAPQFSLYCHPSIQQKRYSIRDSLAKDVSFPQASSLALERLPNENMHWVTEPQQLSENILLSGSIPRRTDFEDTGGPFYLDKNAIDADLIVDELVLLCKVTGGIVVCTGCSHSGIINILHWVQERFPDQTIKAVIGGFHLCNASKERMQKTIAALQNMQIEQLIPCHCTGEAAMDTLIQELPGKVCRGAAGRTWEF
ncbi:MAG: MBL fold metallo-hydrolase [Lentisphaeria bacterium]